MTDQANPVEVYERVRDGYSDSGMVFQAVHIVDCADAALAYMAEQVAERDERIAEAHKTCADTVTLGKEWRERALRAEAELDELTRWNVAAIDAAIGKMTALRRAKRAEADLATAQAEVEHLKDLLELANDARDSWEAAYHAS